MADYIANGLQAIEKSLRDVVMPAIDPQDPLAREQVALAIDFIAFARERLDRLPMQLRFELDHYRAMARAVIAAAPSQLGGGALEALIARNARLDDDPRVRPEVLRNAIEELAQGVDAFVDAAAEADTAIRTAVDRTVCASSSRWIDMQLAWYAPIAIDPDAGDILPLESFFEQASAACEPAR